MAKTRKNSNSSSNDLETQMAKADDLFQKTTFDKKQKDFMKAAFMLIKNLTIKVSDLIDQNEKLILENEIKDETIDSLIDDIKISNKRIIDLEYKDCKNKVRIDGIEYIESENGFESPDQTCKSFQKILNDMDIPETKFNECHRVKKSEKTTKPPSIVVNFENSSEQANFFTNLAKLPTDKKIQVSQEFPPSLRNELKHCQQIAYFERLRGYKTCIKYESFGLSLFIKKGSKRWTKYDPRK